MSQKRNITGNTVIPHHKYINPATDFGFKLIFKDEEITRGFNSLLPCTLSVASAIQRLNQAH